jgi:metal-sulfur cluster biosynthetic enzyme
MRTVVDPCSVQTGLAIDIVDMGLVTDIRQDAEGGVTISVRATNPMCTLIASIMQSVEESVAAVHGVRQVEVRLDPRMDWTEADINGRGGEALELRRRPLRITGALNTWPRKSLSDKAAGSHAP